MDVFSGFLRLVNCFPYNSILFVYFVDRNLFVAYTALDDEVSMTSFLECKHLEFNITFISYYRFFLFLSLKYVPS